MRQSLAAALLVAGSLADGPALARAAPPPAPEATDRNSDEFYEMLATILTGAPMGPGGGWFHPSASRYSWEWLAAKHAISPKEAIPKDKFRGSPELFARLDRNHDGVLRAEDFDWSPPRPKGPPPEVKAPPLETKKPPSGMPDRTTLLKGLFTGELGSHTLGPKVEQLAPDFSLRTQDGKGPIRLSDFRDRKPVVLVFGSFT